MTFLRLSSIGFALALLMSSGGALAQFSQPPPTKSAPVCSEQKAPTKECRDVLKHTVLTFLECSYRNGLSCTSESWYSSDQSVVRIKWNVLKYYWAYVVDGVEYYPSPSELDWISIGCGQTRRGYIRITAGGSTVIKEFSCPAPVGTVPGS
jgi:hypothetical protein